jgi:hypothetical protein
LTHYEQRLRDARDDKNRFLYWKTRVENVQTALRDTQHP